MDMFRAKEIAASPAMVNVTYNGERIYIQSVNDQRQTAKIYPLDQPEREQEVELRNLVER